MTKTLHFQHLSLGHFVICYSNLFRISDFYIRIWSEYDFSFRHYLVSVKSFSFTIFNWGRLGFIEMQRLR